MIKIKGVEFRSLEEQVYKNMIDIAEQALALTALDGRVTALEQGGGGGGEPPANMMTTDTEQYVSGAKYFGNEDDGWFVKLPGNNPETDDAEIAIQYGSQSIVIGRNEIKKDNNYTYYYPNSSGTLATTDDAKKYYLHKINMYSDATGGPPKVNFQDVIFTSSRSTPYTLSSFVNMGVTELQNIINRIPLNNIRNESDAGEIKLFVTVSQSQQGHPILNIVSISGIETMTPDFIQSNYSVEIDNSWTFTSDIVTEL